MNSAPCRWNELDAAGIFEGTGVFRHAVAEARPVEQGSVDRYGDWIAGGFHGGMKYLERHASLRSDPRQLLEGARSVICCAFAYFTPFTRPPESLRIARYALGLDYHDILRKRLDTAAARIRATYGGETRVCVDTAPIRERYWAARSGLGFTGRNNQLIIPGHGSYFFLGEILTTVAFRPTEPSAQLKKAAAACAVCGRCIKACPTGALGEDGRCDARRCLSYLTIEHRGDFPDGTDLHGTFYGCDRCAEACPHNSRPPLCTIDELRPNPRLLSLTAEEMLAMTQEEYTGLFRGSAMKRAKLAGLHRNAAAIAKSCLSKK